jgi:carbamoyl-phosphate synthase large subunit
MPRDPSIKKVLLLGSGAIRIGQAGEFDYSGSQALKAIREEGIETILINPNIATIQTDPNLCDKVYLLPITPEYVEQIIAKERPDTVLLGFGGQTSINVGIQLEKAGIFAKYGVKPRGSSIHAIEATEDREFFRQEMFKAGVHICKSAAANTLDGALKIVDEIGYPVIIRVGYTLGGQGSGVAYTEKEFIEIVDRALAQSLNTQVLVEEYIGGWKEIEYEVVRDDADNCITVCNMENVDPVGIHTGESVVIAPSMTLTDEEYQMLRSASIRVIRQLGMIGECNIQFALHPTSLEFRAIEVNPRLSRSSALASKATGYPLAYVAAKLSIGYLLPELTNRVTNITTACFEPALDYVVVKIPRWDLQKFQKVSRRIGPQMKSVGEVMGIGRTFEEATQKACRMLDIGMRGLVCNDDVMPPLKTLDEYREEMKHATDLRYFRIPQAIRSGLSIDEIYNLSMVDKYFLYKIEHLLELEDKLKTLRVTSPDDEKFYWIQEAKKFGFSDGQIAYCMKTDHLVIRRLRRRFNIIPVVKQIDTLAAEWPAETNYLYVTYDGSQDDIDFSASNGKKKIIVLGSGVYRIGSSVEFDWGCVNMALALKKKGVDEVIMVNYNPETVSTDYDMSDKLYFEELSGERVLDISEKEHPFGIVVSVGGQIATNLTQKLTKYQDVFRTSGIQILGTLGRNIDKAENRAKFSQLCDQLGIAQPQWKKLASYSGALAFASQVGYPVLVRPSYVLSGAAMRVAQTPEQLSDFLQLATKVSQDNPVVITKFLIEAREIECDGISDGNYVLIGAIIEHIENAGIHSGDATMVIPPQTLPPVTIQKIAEYSRQIALALNIRGPFNIQYLVKNGAVSVIECNLRSSRSMPYVSKTRGINLITIAAEVILGQQIKDIVKDVPLGNYACVKSPMFSFMRLSGADPVLGVEMVSTGEVACIGEDFYDALLKAMIAAEFRIPLKGNVLITVGGEELKQQVIPVAKELVNLGFRIFATAHTADHLENAGIKVVRLHKVSETKLEPNLLNCILKGSIQMVINLPLPSVVVEEFNSIMQDEYVIRRKAVEFNIPCITNLQLAKAVVEAIKRKRTAGIKVKSLNEYHKDLKITYW